MQLNINFLDAAHLLDLLENGVNDIEKGETVDLVGSKKETFEKVINQINQSIEEFDNRTAKLRAEILEEKQKEEKREAELNNYIPVKAEIYSNGINATLHVWSKNETFVSLNEWDNSQPYSELKIKLIEQNFTVCSDLSRTELNELLNNGKVIEFKLYRN